MVKPEVRNTTCWWHALRLGDHYQTFPFLVHQRELAPLWQGFSSLCDVFSVQQSKMSLRQTHTKILCNVVCLLRCFGRNTLRGGNVGLEIFTYKKVIGRKRDNGAHGIQKLHWLIFMNGETTPLYRWANLERHSATSKWFCER